MIYFWSLDRMGLVLHSALFAKPTVGSRTRNISCRTWRQSAQSLQLNCGLLQATEGQWTSITVGPRDLGLPHPPCSLAWVCQQLGIESVKMAAIPVPHWVSSIDSFQASSLAHEPERVFRLNSPLSPSNFARNVLTLTLHRSICLTSSERWQIL